MKIDCISDLHGFQPKLEGGDLLIVAGDLTARDTVEEYITFNSWLSDQNYDRKIIIAGNHDGKIEKGIYVQTFKIQAVNMKV
jgi:3',5'-cyclic AMP phosphodiesterase CpdA